MIKRNVGCACRVRFALPTTHRPKEKNEQNLTCENCLLEKDSRSRGLTASSQIRKGAITGEAQDRPGEKTKSGENPKTEGTAYRVAM